jgi:hypothetical protein
MDDCEKAGLVLSPKTLKTVYMSIAQRWMSIVTSFPVSLRIPERQY